MRQARRGTERRLALGRAGAGMVLLGVVAGLPLPAVASDVAKAIEDSRQLLRKGDVKTAIIQLKKTVKDNPDSVDARVELGTVELQTGDFIAAEAELKTAREKGASPAQINPQLAAALLYQGKFADVVNSVKPCPDDTRCKAGVLAVHARAHLALKQANLADADSKEAMEAAPNEISVQLTRGLVLIAQGDFTSAEQVIDQVLATQPKNVEALLAKGDIRREAGDYAGAETAFRTASEISPRNIAARTRLAMAQLAQSKDDDAQETIDKVLAQAPKSVFATYLKGLVLTRAGKMKQALDVVRPLEREIAQSPRGVFLLATVHAANNNLEEALNYAGIYHSQNPDDIVGAKLLASIGFRVGAYDRVVATLAPLHDRLIQDPAALNLLGAAYLAEGRVKEANDVLSEVVKHHPEDVAARGQLALTKARQANTREEGIHELEEIVNSDPKNAKLDLLLISLHMGNGDFDRAIAAATAMSTRQPSNPLPLTMRGAAKLAKGDEAGAGEDFALALQKAPDYTPAAIYQSEIAMRDGDFPKARDVVDKILVKNPADIRALLARAQIEERAGTKAAALPFLERAVAAHPDDLEPRAQLISALVAGSDKAKAVAAANDLARTMPNNPTALDLAAKTLVLSGRAQDGVSLYQQLAGQLPKSAPTHYKLGEALEAAGDSVSAKAAYDRALSSNRDYIPAWAARINLEKKTSGLDAALALAEKAVKDNPKNEALKVLGGDLYAEDSRWADAEAYYRKQLAVAPTPLLSSHLFDVLVRSGDYPKARQYMTEWIAKHPDDFGARMQLSQEEIRRQDDKNASELLATMAAKSPKNVAVLNNLAFVYGRMHDPRALDIAKRAYLAAPANAQVADTYGELLREGGDLKQATNMLQQAHNTLPGDPSISLHLARVLGEGKDRDGALKLLKPLVDPKNQFAEQDDAKKLYAQLGGT